MNKIKVLFWGDAVIETGFARVLHSISKYLPAHFDVSWIGVNYYGDPHPYKERIYPASSRGDIYGLNRLPEICDREKPDIIFILNDAWIQAPMIDAIRKKYAGETMPKIVTYTPVDAMDHDGEWYHNFSHVTIPVAYTDFGRREIIKAAPDLEANIRIVPHGVDLSIFHKLTETKQAIREKLVGDRPDFIESSFVVLNAGRNQPRKRIDITIESFYMFSKDKPADVKLYLHMGTKDSHVDILKLARRYGIVDRLAISGKTIGVMNLPASTLNAIYNACDVGLNTGVGEGWSLPNIEHAVTGAPQVVPDHSALRELYWDCGLLVPTSQKLVLDNINTTGMLVKPESVAEKLEALYNDKELFKQVSAAGLAKFTGPQYSWQNISKTWARIFEEAMK